MDVRQIAGNLLNDGDLQRAQLWQVLSGPAPDGGLWNGRKVADWLSEWTGEQISRHRGWEYLREMGYRLKVPRPQHQETDISQQQQWKKTSFRVEFFTS